MDKPALFFNTNFITKMDRETYRFRSFDKETYDKISVMENIEYSCVDGLWFHFKEWTKHD